MKRKHVVRFDLPLNPAFDQRLAHESDIDLAVCARAGPEEPGWAALERSHVYHVSATKDELPRRWFVSTELLQRCPTLLCVSSAGAGYDTVDVAGCTKAGVAVVNQAGGNANSVAEHAFGLMLALSRRIIECDRRLRREQGLSREDFMGHEIGGKVLGIVGIGHIGTRVAALAHAFGMSVLATDPYLTEEEIGRRGATSVVLEDLLARSDIVSLHCPRAGHHQHDRRASVAADEARRAVHHDGARRHPRRGSIVRGAPVRPYRRRRARRVRARTASARPPAAQARQRDRELPYRRRDA